MTSGELLVDSALVLNLDTSFPIWCRLPPLSPMTDLSLSGAYHFYNCLLTTD